MDFQKLRGELQQKKVRPAYLFTGDQDLLKEEALDALRRAAAGERAAVRKLYVGEAGAAAILEAQQNFSLLEVVGAVVVRLASKLGKADCEILGREIARVPGGPPIVFWDVSLDKRIALFGDIARSGGEVEFDAFNRGDARDWAKGEAERLGHRLGAAAAGLVVELVGTDLLALRSALEKLSVAVGAGKAIDEAAVTRRVASARDHALWELQDAITVRQTTKAIRVFREIVEEGTEPPLIVGALFSHVRRLLLAREIPKGTPEYAAARELGVRDFKVKDLIAAARSFPPAMLRGAIEVLADIDVGFKTGRIDPIVAMESWLLGLCGTGESAHA